MSSLRVLEIAENKLRRVPDVVVSKMPELREVYVGDNRIEKLPRDLGKRLSKVEKVMLEANPIPALPVAELAGASRLQELGLGYIEGLQLDKGSADTLLENHRRLERVHLVKWEGHDASTPETRRVAGTLEKRLAERRRRSGRG